MVSSNTEQAKDHEPENDCPSQQNFEHLDANSTVPTSASAAPSATPNFQAGDSMTQGKVEKIYR